MSAIAPALDRPALLRRGLRLEYLTVGWNVIEGSVALLGFRINSPLAAFGIAFFLVREGLDAWRGEREEDDAEPSAVGPT